MIGSSLLFVHDRTNASVWLIDFAKTVGLPDNVQIDHNSKWTVGNHEDGYLIGINNMVDIFTELLEQANSSPRSSLSSAGGSSSSSTSTAGDNAKAGLENSFSDDLSASMDRMHIGDERGHDAKEESSPLHQQNESNNVFRMSNAAPSIIKTNSSQQILILDNSHRKENRTDGGGGVGEEKEEED